MKSVPDSAAKGCVIAFDLDDTLCSETDYVRGGFEAVGAWLEKARGIAGFTPLALKALDEGVRGTIFDHVLKQTGQEDAIHTLVPEMIAVYRGHTPKLRLAPEVADMLRTLSLRAHLAVVTDGPLAVQRAKVAALGLENFVDTVICTDQWGRAHWKPAPRAYEEVERLYPMPRRDLYAYVGDNPAKDFITPRKNGWRTVRLIQKGGLHESDAAPAPEYEAEANVTALADLTAELRRLGLPV